MIICNNFFITISNMILHFTMLKDYVNGISDTEPKEAVSMVQHWYPEAKFVNVEA